MRKLWLVVLMGIGLLGCSNDDPQTGLATIVRGSSAEVAFSNGKGKLQVSYADTAVDLIVRAKGLDPKQQYTITLHRDHEGGLTFGPEANVKISKGALTNEVYFQSNRNGELFISMLNPERIMLGAGELIVYLNQDNNVVAQSAPFTIRDNE